MTSPTISIRTSSFPPPLHPSFYSFLFSFHKIKSSLLKEMKDEIKASTQKIETNLKVTLTLYYNTHWKYVFYKPEGKQHFSKGKTTKKGKTKPKLK